MWKERRGWCRWGGGACNSCRCQRAVPTSQGLQSTPFTFSFSAPLTSPPLPSLALPLPLLFPPLDSFQKVIVMNKRRVLCLFVCLLIAFKNNFPSTTGQKHVSSFPKKIKNPERQGEARGAAATARAVYNFHNSDKCKKRRMNEGRGIQKNHTSTRRDTRTLINAHTHTY